MKRLHFGGVYLDSKELLRWKNEAGRMLQENILAYWIDHAQDNVNGGFYGRILSDGNRPEPYASKALVLNTRILWTFSHAYYLYKSDDYRTMAERAWMYICHHFWDQENGGAFWSVNYEGHPTVREKRTYGQSFLIYSFAEYARVFQSEEALKMANQTYELLFRNARVANGGFVEAVGETWVRLPYGETACVVGTNIHVFEALASLYEISQDTRLKTHLNDMMNWFMDNACDVDGQHMKARIRLDVSRADNEICFGHDAELSYLITGCADILQDEKLKTRTARFEEKMMTALLEEGLDGKDGGVFYDMDCKTGKKHPQKIWWAQAECVIGLLDAAQHTKNETFLQAAYSVWNCIKDNLCDFKNGEWLPMDKHALEAIQQRPNENPFGWLAWKHKVSEVKGPYHNARMCFQLMRRLP
jgi:mannobiose 2-epimerase